MPAMGARIILLLVDGLGLGTEDSSVNPLHSGACPALLKFLANNATPIDAQLGIPGLPQSATGQTSLLTGVNAQELLNRHVEGFPGPELKEIIREHNIFGQLKKRGLRSTFANAYFLQEGSVLEKKRLWSVTTVAAMHAFGRVRDEKVMAADAAVYQDLTRASLRERGYSGPLVTPEDSADHLVEIAMEYDLTLFEYFQTDRAAHKQDHAKIRRVLQQLDAFIGRLAARAEKDGLLVVLTSDHGNVEDTRTRQHTMNPVPLMAIGEGADDLRARIRSLLDVTPVLVGLLTS